MASVLITGANGFLGSHVADLFKKDDNYELITYSSRNWDLTDEGLTRNYIHHYKPDILIHLAAKVGGIGANQKYPADFCYDNLKMGMNIIEACKGLGTKLVQVGTVCSYPKFTPVPFKEEDLWNGYPEETNAPYGLAKKMLYTMAEAYKQQYGLNSIYLVPVNLYGPRDNFNPEFSHVIPALILKIHKAKEKNEDLVIWGTGSASREFLYVEDAARAIYKAALELNELTPVNLGSGQETTIKELVEILCDIEGFTGNIVWDSSKPDGQPRRSLDTSKAEKLFNWKAFTPLRLGLLQTSNWFHLYSGLSLNYE